MDLNQELKDALHLLDLRQIEVVQQMIQQANQDLGAYYQLGEGVSAGLQRKVHLRLKLKAVEKVDPAQVEEALAEVEKEQEKQLLAIKAAVFNATNTLRQLHDQRQNLIKAHAEQPEDTDDEE